MNGSAATDIPATTRNELYDFVRLGVASGFDSEEDIVRSAVDVYSDEGVNPTLLEPLAKRLTREAWENHLRDQARWPPITDCDRLTASFEELDSRGIISRQNFTDCGTCGVSEMESLVRDLSSAGRKVRGYSFFHMQDTEHAAQGDGLYLNYGSVEATETTALAIAREVVASLTKHGLKTEWDGSWKTRIGVTLDWKRRR